MKMIQFLFLILSSVAFSQTKSQLPVHKFVLKNGLTVLLHPDSSVPLISYHTWYKVGSRDEQPGITGSAHMLEHMMFKGAKKFTGKDFDRTLNENGMVNNAFTTNDYTGFYQSLPSSKLELMMQLEVDRMKDLALKAEDLLSEKEVVKEERRWRVDNSPMGLLRELTNSTVYKVHPYTWPVIGTMKDISNYNVDVLRKFYETWYVPNNAVLVLAGDFKVSEAKRMVEKYYGPLPSKPLPERKIPAEPPQKAQRNASLKQDVQSSTFIVAFPTVQHGNEDMYALDVAAQILGSGVSSRLYKRLVYANQIATSASAWSENKLDSGSFAVAVSMKPGLEHQQALNLVFNELYKLRNKPVSEEEIKKSKILSKKNVIDAMVTIDSRARLLASYEILTGSYESVFADIEKYNSVTAADVQRVANKYFNQTQRSIVVLEPIKKVVSNE